MVTVATEQGEIQEYNDLGTGEKKNTAQCCKGKYYMPYKGYWVARVVKIKRKKWKTCYEKIWQAEGCSHIIDSKTWSGHTHWTYTNWKTSSKGLPIVDVSLDPAIDSKTDCKGDMCQ